MWLCGFIWFFGKLFKVCVMVVFVDGRNVGNERR